MAETRDPRRFIERRLPSLLEVVRPVVAAAAVAFVIDIALAPPATMLELVGKLTVYPVAVVIALLIGRWFGLRSWPGRGRRLARALLARHVRGRRRSLLLLTGRPDLEATTWRRVLEVVGFAAGVSILVPAVLQVAGAPARVVQVTGTVITLLALWGSFVLVPYWALARLGIRRVDPVRWFVQPLSILYAGRLRLSNGALLLVAVVVAANLAFRAGAEGDEALVEGVLTATRLVASLLVVAAAGVVYFARGERVLVRELEREAFAMGVVDARGVSDGDLLPRVSPFL